MPPCQQSGYGVYTADNKYITFDDAGNTKAIAALKKSKKKDDLQTVIALLKARLDRLDADGVPAFLETATEANVRLYSRHGFEVIGEYNAPPDGPKNWAMWREPRTPC